ncbi:hypothetical protein IFM89_026639 [Coptis chinensis]|uniref:Uncharacterized protein n=1 Tax=Coptis chinensis TaxID=261450 RepID=A0A835H0Q0_9MAGN|nr:hypothetical protein IFM89_026639 [Coptis chinensis]
MLSSEHQNSAARTLCFQEMMHYGYEIVQILIVDIKPDEHVKRAMNEINKESYGVGNKDVLSHSCIHDQLLEQRKIQWPPSGATTMVANAPVDSLLEPSAKHEVTFSKGLRGS